MSLSDAETIASDNGLQRAASGSRGVRWSRGPMGSLYSVNKNYYSSRHCGGTEMRKKTVTYEKGRKHLRYITPPRGGDYIITPFATNANNNPEAEGAIPSLYCHIRTSHAYVHEGYSLGDAWAYIYPPALPY